jgi:hypothetical protein
VAKIANPITHFSQDEMPRRTPCTVALDVAEVALDNGKDSPQYAQNFEVEGIMLPHPRHFTSAFPYNY